DLNLDGQPEIIAGNTVYRNDGAILFAVSARDGFAAVANFNDDPYPEIVLATNIVPYGGGAVYLFDHTGKTIWGPVLMPIGGRAGAPTIADFDGDGKPEIGVAGAYRYMVIKSDGSILWQSVIKDSSSHLTGSSVFDFDGDGKVEVVYNDENKLYIFRGSDGKVLFETPNSNGTMFEYPVIVDVDNDGHAEIVVSANGSLYNGPDHGIRVFEDANNTWVNTRKIWNQHTYHITNVNDDGTIPRYEQNNWEIYNNYRCNSLLPDQVLATADITASYITIEQTNYPTSVRVSARLGNGGAVSQIAGIDIAFYDGAPDQGGVLLGSTKTARVLGVGDYEDVSITWTNPSAGNHTVYIVADNTNKFNECRENNNITSASLNIGISQPQILYTPDLEISPADITIIPPVIEGQSPVITAIVHNTGNLGASDAVISFYDGDPQSGGLLIGSVTKSFVDAGATALAEVTWDTMGQSGRNYLHVVVDPQGLIPESNENNNSALIPVDVTPPAKPDLAITGSDIAFSSLNPAEGRLLTLTAMIRNLGLQTANVGVVLYDGDPASGGSLIAMKTIYQIIPFGGAVSMSFDIPTTGMAGNHKYYLSLDPGHMIDEINEANNVAWNSVTIGASGLALSITTDKAVYTANENISITLNVTNQRDAGRTGTLEVKLLDSTGTVVSNATVSQALTLGPSETQTLSFLLNSGSILAGDYRVFSQFIEAGYAVSRIDTPITIIAGREISSGVTTDRIAYFPNQQAVITAAVTSLSANYIFENLKAAIAVSDQQLGSSLHTETQPIPILLPGQSTELKTYWNTSTNPSGAYPVTLEIRDASGVLVSSSTATITISSEIKPSKLLRGQVSVDKQSILQGEPVTFSYQVTNLGNMDISQADLSIKTVHVVNLSVYDTLTDQTALLMDASYANTRQLATGSYSAKDYLVILAASINGVEETLASTYFRVEGAPSAPSLNAPSHGSDVETITPILSINNATDPNDDSLTYEFEIYSDSGLSNLIASSGMIPEGTGTTSWHPLAGMGQGSLILQENGWYFWRARAYDSRLYGQWMTPAAFRVNVTNEPPTAPTLSAPAEGSSVDSWTPGLTVNNASDPDSPNLTYNFVLALDPDFVNIVEQQVGIFAGQGSTSWQVIVPLQENSWYYWRAQADDWLITGPWMTTAQFFVNTVNEAPTAPVIIEPLDNSEAASGDVVITVSNSIDSDPAVISYFFEVDSSLTFDSPERISSGSVPQGITTTSWMASGLKDNTYYYARV
ncbi:MAG: VCBS repeat-containing protein, partial [Nitrospirae bacterium]|nr:VCBS repeat-containing protein [Nitrospirota bacterium]